MAIAIPATGNTAEGVLADAGFASCFGFGVPSANDRSA